MKQAVLHFLFGGTMPLVFLKEFVLLLFFSKLNKRTKKYSSVTSANNLSNILE